MSASAAGKHCSESERLFEAARAGDRAVFGQLVESYRPYLKAVANRVLSEHLRSDGSDVVQNGLCLAFERLAQFRGQEPAAFLGWLASIVRNEALRFLRRAGRGQPLPDGPTGGELAGNSSGPDARAVRREEAARLLAAIQRLPEDHRTVIELRNLKELRFEIVAQCMGRSSPAVRKLWNRAMDRLREEMGDEP
jgi:RNA polymerase sigma-70 factor (ECF subfamily)